MSLHIILKSKIFIGTMMGIAIVIIVLLVLQVGIFIGYRKASFSYRWGDNYYRTFGERREGRFPAILRDSMMPTHGVAGKILKIELPTIIIEAPDGTERVVVINDKTVARRFRDAIPVSELKPNDSIIVIGSPNDQSQIVASLIRLAPPPPDFPRPTNSPR